MPFQKYATATILEARAGGDNRGLMKSAHRHEFHYTPRLGYIYARSRAISSRANDNHDYFPAAEIEQAYKSFIGKPVFVNHNNSDHRRARGVIIDAALHKDINPDGSPDTWVELLHEIDAVKFPKLAKAILSGEIDRTSMGCDVTISKCSACGNEATTPLEYCKHIPGMKGKKLYTVGKNGQREGKLIFEECRGLSFFENSFLVEQPADPTAYVLGNVESGPGLEKLHSSINKTASRSAPIPVTPRTIMPEFTFTAHIWDLINQELDLDYKTGAVLDTSQPYDLINGIQFEAKAGKPVSQMSDEEYATHKVNTAKEKEAGEAWNKANPVGAHNIVDHWNRSTPDEKANGETWYQDAHHLTRTVAHDTDTPIHTMSGLMSNYSPQTHWATNMMNAAKVARTRTPMGGPGEGIMATTNQKKAAGRMLNGEHYDKVLSGPKTKAFAHLIEHGGNADPNDPKVVVDRHALSVAAGARASDNAYTYSKLGNKGRYHEVSNAYHQAAKHISKQEGRPIEAHQVQAVTWLTRQRLNEQHDRDLSATASSASGSKSRSAVKEWNEYAAEHHPSAIGKEPGTGYSKHSIPEDVQHITDMNTEGKTIAKTASFQRLAYGETKAPQDVDTLRDENCTVCGSSDAWDGNTCMVCGYEAPPRAFGDPNTDMAKQLDMKKDDLTGDEADPNDPTNALGQPMGNSPDDEGGDDPAMPDLACSNCGTEIRPAPAQTNDGSNPAPSPAEGDACPFCQQGELVSTGESSEQPSEEQPEDGEPVPGQDVNGDEEDDSDVPPEGEDADSDPDDSDDEDDDSNDKTKDTAELNDDPAKKKKKASKNRQTLNPKVYSVGDNMPARPALSALMEQQKLIDTLIANDRRKTAQIDVLTRGLKAVSKLTGNDLSVRAAMLKIADEQNPAQPVPEPRPEPPTETTVEAETPEAFADVRAPGLVPGSNQDVAADAVSTAYTPGMDIPSPAINQLVDVTRPIDGTQSARPLNETKTLTDVRVGDPMNAQTAFPPNGPFGNAQRTSSADSGTRAVASLRLAKLRIATGTAEHDDETILMDSIHRDASLSDQSIAIEIKALERVRTASKREEAPRNLVPQSAAPTPVRTVPAMNKQARNDLAPQDADAQDLFLSFDL